MESTLFDNAYKLSELGESIEQVLHGCFPNSVRVEAEIAELRVNRGHCYMTLIEKAEGSGDIIAQMRATIWANTYKIISAYFFESTGVQLQSGIKVMLQCKVSYHTLYGLSLNVVGVDPEYTIGALAIARREIVQRLEKEGIINLNKQLEFPLLPLRIAVISSDTAAGYGDFLNHIENDTHGYSFQVVLFRSLMQGNGVEKSLIAALDAVFARLDEFDVVVVIRGGGASIDLSCFDNYEIAAHIAQFPLPIISGIGHQRDDTIVDLVAHSRVKTPTAAADLILQTLINTENEVLLRAEQIVNTAYHRLEEENTTLSNYLMRMNSSMKGKIVLENRHLEQQHEHMMTAVKLKLQNIGTHLQLLQRVVRSYDPESYLRRGYVLVEHEGKIAKSVNELAVDDIVVLQFHDGKKQAKIITNNETTDL